MYEIFNTLQDLKKVRSKGIKNIPNPFKHITNFYNNCNAFNTENTALLKSFIGHCISNYWVIMGDFKATYIEPEAPIIIEINGQFYYLIGNIEDEFTIGISKFDTNKPLEWYGDFKWQKNTIPEMNHCLNKTITSIGTIGSQQILNINTPSLLHLKESCKSILGLQFIFSDNKKTSIINDITGMAIITDSELKPCIQI